MHTAAWPSKLQGSLEKLLSRAWRKRRRGKDRPGSPEARTSGRPAKHCYPAQADDDERLTALVDAVKDFQLSHGSLVKLVQTEEEHTVLARPIGVTLRPTRLPRKCFDEAVALQRQFNALYAAIAQDEDWLKRAVEPLLLVPGSLAAKLWSIHSEVKEERYVQDTTLGLFRSDYMLQDGQCAATLKQVEFNTFSCAGIAHGNRASAMHRHLCRSGAYDGLDGPISVEHLPHNDGLNGAVLALTAADEQYRRQSGHRAGTTAVLMVVQPWNVNVADERPFEYGLWEEGVGAYRKAWGADLLASTHLDDARRLFFHPPGQRGEAIQISVVYHRAGYEEEEYDDDGMQCRLRLERSRSIKCPSILAHLAGFKRVQQVLAMPGQVERFLGDKAAGRIRDTFAAMYPLDDSPAGLVGRALACRPDSAARHVLKPSLEGGGHNVYHGAIPSFLASMPETAWDRYVLMRCISPPASSNVLLGPHGLYAGATESELGIVGVCMWASDGHGAETSSARIEVNRCAGFTLKTKAKGVNEMSVIKGYGCFDSPLLEQ